MSLWLEFFLEKIGRFRKKKEFSEKEKAPRYSAGQPNIDEFDSENNQNHQKEGVPHDITRGK